MVDEVGKITVIYLDGSYWHIDCTDDDLENMPDAVDSSYRYEMRKHIDRIEDTIRYVKKVWGFDLGFRIVVKTNKPATYKLQACLFLLFF